MVRTSPTDREYTELDLETLDLISTLTRMPGFKRLAEVIDAERKKYFANRAGFFARSNTPVDQREIDYKRGFFQGAMWAVQALPKIKTAEWDAYVKSAAEESENPE